MIHRHSTVAAVQLAVLLWAGTSYAVPISCDQVLPCSVSSPGATCSFEFTVSNQEVVSINVLETTGGFTAQWRLLNGPNPALSCGAFTTGSFRDCGPLSAGSYQVEVKSFSGTGSADVTMQRLTAVAGCETRYDRKVWMRE